MHVCLNSSCPYFSLGSESFGVVSKFLKIHLFYFPLAVLILRYFAVAFSSCGTWASHCSGFSFCRARALGSGLSSCGARA